MASEPSVFYQILRGRRSVRRFEAQPVEPEVLWRLFEAATLAPSAHNSQPWRFAVLMNPATRRRLAETMGRAFRSHLEGDGRPAQEIAQAVERSRQRIDQAPVAVVIALSMRDADHYPDPQRQEAEHTMAVQGVALAVENLLLAAQAEGLGGCWLCWPLFCPDLVAKELSLPADWEPLAMILLGRPSRPVLPPQRQPLDQVVVWR